MKYAFFVSLAIFLTGLGILLFGGNNQDFYYATGKLSLNAKQWEQFKQDIAEIPSVSIGDISYLDSGELKIVEFHSILVDKDFQWGELKKTTGKDQNSCLGGIEMICLIFGGPVAFVTALASRLG